MVPPGKVLVEGKYMRSRLQCKRARTQRRPPSASWRFGAPSPTSRPSPTTSSPGCWRSGDFDDRHRLLRIAIQLPAGRRREARPVLGGLAAMLALFYALRCARRSSPGRRRRESWAGNRRGSTGRRAGPRPPRRARGRRARAGIAGWSYWKSGRSTSRFRGDLALDYGVVRPLRRLQCRRRRRSRPAGCGSSCRGRSSCR